MKKWLITILILLLLFIGSVYVFIPNFITLNQSISISANNHGLYRNLVDGNNWIKWWPESSPGKIRDSSGYFTHNDYTYAISDKKTFSLLISISQKDFINISSFNIIALKLDSTRLDWEARIPSSYNPLKRLQIYLKAKQLRNNMKTILEKIKSYYSHTENLYGYDIRKALVVDTALVSTSALSTGYPSIAFIYSLIDRLKNYIASQYAKETGFPMLNISTTDSVSFFTKVALPVNKKLPTTGDFAYKWMLRGGNILITEVKGGPASINEAVRRMEDYIIDHQRITPAIHFLSLVKDLRQEPDTAKWITLVYYPVM